jgi:SAM-dependent methyltransferase
MAHDHFGPDPAAGLEASPAYAEHYAKSHRAAPTLDYRRGYLCSILIDALLDDYVLLEVGCGTGGYFRLARHHRRIIGLDFSKSMIEEGRALAAELGLERIELVHGKFETYDPPGAIDAVNLAGVIGWYVPWIGNEHVLAKARAMLRPGGIAVFSFVKPRRWLQSLKAILFPRRTVLIPEKRFLGLARQAGFEIMFLLDAAPNVYVFCRARETAPA